MPVKEWIIPQEKRFFDLLNRVATNLVSGAVALAEMVEGDGQFPERRKALKDIEHRGDDAVHEIYEALNRTFITPIDREDIQALASNMDNVLDLIYASALRLELYEVRPTPPMVRLAGLIRTACRRIEEAVRLIRDMRNGDRVEALSVELNGLENAADDVLNEAVAELFRTSDPITIIKLKEIYENMEAATDYCEDVADILSDVVAKNR